LNGVLKGEKEIDTENEIEIVETEFDFEIETVETEFESESEAGVVENEIETVGATEADSIRNESIKNKIIHISNLVNIF